jgi:hypothetical protein
MTRRFGVSAVIGRSFSWTEKVLFKPFSAGKWLRLVVISFLAGSVGYSGRLHMPDLPSRRDRARASAPASPGGTGVSAPAPSSGAEASAPSSPAAPEQKKEKEDPFPKLRDRVLAKMGPALHQARAWAAAHWPLVGTAAAVLILAMVFFMWLHARFTFVWFNAIRENTGDISGPFDLYAGPGNSLFRLNLALSLFSLLVAAGLLYWGAHAARTLGMWSPDYKWELGAFFEAFGRPLAALLAMGLLEGLFYFFLYHFVVTIMAMDDARVAASLGKFLGVLRGRVTAVFVYVLAWIVLKFVAAIMAMVVAVIAVLGLLAAGAILLGVPYLVLAKIMGLKVLAAVLMAVIGLPFFALSVVFLICLQLPFAVFFKSFSLHFMSSLECGYDPLPLEPAEAAE